MQTLILPVASRKGRYPGMRPKWLLTHPHGTLMITEAIRGINPLQFKEIIIVALESQQLDYNFCDIVINEISEEYKINKDKIKIILLKRDTLSQPETVYEGIKQANITGQILIKDSDNYFTLPKLLEKNFISVVNLDKNGPFILKDKSYVKSNELNCLLVKEIIEKKIVSNLFCCGVYSFLNAETFCQYFEKLKSQSPLYLSHIVQDMIHNEQEFNIVEVNDFKDWGTQKDWINFKKSYGSIFIDLDGIIFLNSNKHFEPKWGKTEALRRNVLTINRLYDSGKYEIIILTSRKESFKQITLDQLNKSSIRYHRILFGLYTGSKKIIISSPSDNHMFPAAIAINTRIDDDRLDEYLQ